MAKRLKASVDLRGVWGLRVTGEGELGANLIYTSKNQASGIFHTNQLVLKTEGESMMNKHFVRLKFGKFEAITLSFQQGRPTALKTYFCNSSSTPTYSMG